jgi:hypothetical protein
MELGQLLARSGLTCPEVSVKPVARLHNQEIIWDPANTSVMRRQM